MGGRRGGDDDVVVRKDDRGGVRIAPDWETLTERLIREAQEDGAFDDLPASGRPLELEDDAAAGERAVAFRLLRNADIAPDWIEADKEVRRLRAAIDLIIERAASDGAAGSSARRRLADLLAHEARAVGRLNATAPTERQHRIPLDAPTILARLDAAAGSR